MSNYKPFSLFAVFSKMFEKVVYKRVIHCLNSNSILVNELVGVIEKTCSLAKLGTFNMDHSVPSH
jgi:hypothetical protein